MIILFSACSSKIDSPVGKWVEPINGQDGGFQGITLNEDGTASSINMHTLVFEKWQKVGDKLVLSGKSIGNGQTIIFTDTMTIQKLTKDSLLLSQNEYVVRYSKQK